MKNYIIPGILKKIWTVFEKRLFEFSSKLKFDKATDQDIIEEFYSTYSTVLQQSPSFAKAKLRMVGTTLWHCTSPSPCIKFIYVYIWWILFLSLQHNFKSNVYFVPWENTECKKCINYGQGNNKWK